VAPFSSVKPIQQGQDSRMVDKLVARASFAEHAVDALGPFALEGVAARPVQ